MGGDYPSKPLVSSCELAPHLPPSTSLAVFIVPHDHHLQLSSPTLAPRTCFPRRPHSSSSSLLPASAVTCSKLSDAILPLLTCVLLVDARELRDLHDDLLERPTISSILLAPARISPRERRHFLKNHADTVHKLLQQMEFRSKYQNLLEDFKSLKEQFTIREAENEKVLTIIREAHEKALTDIREEKYSEVRALQDQIRHSQEELTLRDAAVAHLEQELTYLHSTREEEHHNLEKRLHDEALKYQEEIDDLKNKNQSLLQEKSMLQEQLHIVENEYMIARTNYESKLRESSFSRHTEVFKQKIMRLRKENEDLRLQLVGACCQKTSQGRSNFAIIDHERL